MKEVFINAIELEEGYKLIGDSMFEEVPGWDSVGHMLIITELEERLDIELEIDEVVGVNNVNKLINLAKTKLNQ